jgi:uncharacterized protein (DUF1015 family)
VLTGAERADWRRAVLTGAERGDWAVDVVAGPDEVAPDPVAASSAHRRYHSAVPILRPFRALRYDAASIDLSAVLAPPYDIISPEQRLALLERDPHNAVRIDLPADVGTGDAAAYASAAEALAEWRREGVLVKDAEPTVSVHEMRWTGANGSTSSCTGLLAQLRLEEFGPGSGVLPHERTMKGPKADRLALLRATRTNTSPLVFLAGSEAAAASGLMRELTDRAAEVEATTADGVRHRLWVCPADDAAALLTLVGSAPVTIADGHHRYETALAYRAERARAEDDAAGATGGADPAWDYVMALIYPLDGSPPALPTHRVLADGPVGDALLEVLGEVFEAAVVEDPEALLSLMAGPVELGSAATGTGRIGVISGDRAAELRVKQDAVDAMLGPDLSEASKGLDVNALTCAIERVYGADPGTLAGEGRLTYVKDAAAAADQVARAAAASCFLLDPMPPAAISRVAEAGEVMPQKSTYFDPKPPSGLLFSPLEW